MATTVVMATAVATALATAVGDFLTRIFDLIP
jgi:hypothetical protein